MLRTLLSAFLAICLTAGPGLAATKRSTGKAKASSTKKRTATKKSSRRAPVRRAESTRQQAPTPERYKEIQRALSDKGYYKGEIDGNWDANCVMALKEFQQDQNPNPGGKLGALSIIALGLGPKYESSALVRPEPPTESDQ